MRMKKVGRWISRRYGKCLRLLKKKILIRLALISLALILILSYSRAGPETSGTRERTDYQPSASSPPKNPGIELEPRRRSGPCKFPHLDPFAPPMMALIDMKMFHSTNYSCSEEYTLGIFKDAAFHVEKGHILVRDLDFPENISCCFQTASRGDDEQTVKVDGTCEKIDIEQDATAIQSPTEMVLVTCGTNKGKSLVNLDLGLTTLKEFYYRDAFQILHKKPEVETRIQKWREDEDKVKDGRLSVLVIGIDTTSQMQFERGMPRSKLYLEEKLEAVRFLGYNKVGQGTYPNIFALLCGMTEAEFQDHCVKKTKTKTKISGLVGHDFAKCHCFLWKTFAANGYRTAFAEDNANLAISNYPHANAFSGESPTDYYYRPFSILMEKVLKFGDLCYGPRLSFESLLENAKSIADLFQEDKDNYFNFVWTSKLTHASLDYHQFGDQPLLELLRDLHGNGHLNHTALFVLADHGCNQVPEVEQAKIEAMMPLAYIVLPPWFSRRYSKAFQNLRWNAKNSVTSHFDMHKTILDMMDLTRLEGDDDPWRVNRYFKAILPQMLKRGQSSFEINASGRDCTQAGIPEMFCPCVDRIPLEADSYLAVKGGQAVIDRVNGETGKLWFAGCETLQLGKVLTANVIVMDKDKGILKKAECRFLINNATMEEVEQRTMATPCNKSIGVELIIRGTPHDPIYQTVAYHNANGTFSPPDVLRNDWYSDKGHCVHNELRPYCVCKSYKGHKAAESFLEILQKMIFRVECKLRSDCVSEQNH